MALEATLGNTNLLQLAEALSLNAEKVQPDWDPVRLVTSPDDYCLSHCRSTMTWSNHLMVERVEEMPRVIVHQLFIPVVMR